MADAAFTLGSTLASLGLSESTIRRLLAEKLAASDENRSKSLLSSREGFSGRGMLHSSAALQDQAQTNLSYDRDVASTQGNTADELARIAQQRLDAQAAYNTSIAEQEAKKAAEQEAIKPGFDPADPFNWKGIAAEQAAGIAPPEPPPAFIPPVPGGTPEDPYNWKGIAAERAANTSVPAPGTRVIQPPRRPTPAKPQPTKIQTPRPGQVVRF